MNYTHLMAVPSLTHCIDVINPATGRTCVRDETPDQVRIRHPGAELMTCAAWQAARAATLAAQYLRPPVEIDATRWDEMLCVLPPEDWGGGDGAESFKMSERLDGDWTACFVRIGSRYWELTRKASTTHAELVAIVREHVAAQQ